MSGWNLRKGRNSRGRRQEALSAYLDGELSAREKERIDQELVQNPAFSSELAELRRTVEAVRSLPSLPVPRSFRLDPAIYGQVKPRRVHVYPVLRATTVMVMVLFAFVVTGSLFLRGTSAPSSIEDVAMVVLDATQAVGKEVVVTEAVEVARQQAAEVASAPAESEEAVEAPMAEAPAEEITEMAVLAEEDVNAETEAADGTHREAPAAAMAPVEEPLPTAETLSEFGMESQAPPAETELPPAPESTPLVTPTTIAPAVGELTEPQSPEVHKTTVETPEPSPAWATTAKPEEEPQQSKGRPAELDWWLAVRWGAGLLVGGLLVVTLLARRFDW